MHKRTIITISSAHLTPLLGGDGGITERHDVCAVELDGMGILLWVTPEHIEELKRDPDYTDLVLLGLLRWADEQGADFLHFDSDGQIVAELPTWEW